MPGRRGPPASATERSVLLTIDAEPSAAPARDKGDRLTYGLVQGAAWRHEPSRGKHQQPRQWLTGHAIGQPTADSIAAAMVARPPARHLTTVNLVVPE